MRFGFCEVPEGKLVVHEALVSPSLQVINDLLDPAGQNLRVREDAQVIAVSCLTCQLSTELGDARSKCSAFAFMNIGHLC